MCGIVAYAGPRDSVGVLVDGLKRPEYRGYDSSGIAVFKGDKIELRRSVGKLHKLCTELEKKPLEGNIGPLHPGAAKFWNELNVKVPDAALK